MSLEGKVQTVLGPIPPGSLGFTSSHEHILSDMSLYFAEPEAAGERRLARQPLCLANLAWVRAHRFSHLENMRLGDRQLAIEEVSLFAHAGGGTIVEMSSRGLGRDPAGLAAVARATGVNIVMGCSYYVGLSHPPVLAARGYADVADEIVSEIETGVPGYGVKPGVIGEVGFSGLEPEKEAKVLRASVMAQRRTGAPLVIHPTFGDEALLEILNMLVEWGALLHRTLICHADVFAYSLSACEAVLAAGCFLGFDNFGNLAYPHDYLGRVLNMTGDLERLRRVRELISRGYLSQILFGGDTVFRDQLKSYGGFGYAHLLENVVPLMRACDFAEEEIRAIFLENPQRFLTFGPPVD